MGNDSSSNAGKKVAVRQAKLLIWGPVFLTLSLQKSGEQTTEDTSEVTKNQPDPPRTQIESAKHISETPIIEENSLAQAPDKSSEKTEETSSDEQPASDTKAPSQNDAPAQDSSNIDSPRPPYSGSSKRANLTERHTDSKTPTANEDKGLTEDKPSPESPITVSPPPATEQVTQTESKESDSDKAVGGRKITYIYKLIDHGLDCECIDVKGELLVRSALPFYRKITQGIEFEQISNNQIKLIVTSRVLDHYQEVFQGFAMPKATFRIWILGYRFV